MKRKERRITMDMVRQRLATHIDIGEYCFERSLHDLKYLLEDDRWMKIYPGYTDINEFLISLGLDNFKFAIQQRKGLSKKLEELQASQKAKKKEERKLK